MKQAAIGVVSTLALLCPFLVGSVIAQPSPSIFTIIDQSSYSKERLDFVTQQEFAFEQNIKDFIEEFDLDTQTLTVRSENFFAGQFAGAVLAPGAGRDIRISEVSFDWIGLGTCKWIELFDHLECIGLFTAIWFTYRYQIVPEVEDGHFPYYFGWIWQNTNANITYDLFFPDTLRVIETPKEPNLAEDGHMQWYEENVNRFELELTFLICDLERSFSELKEQCPLREQNEKKHEIDGCSGAPDFASISVWAQASTAIGSVQGTVTADRVNNLPCNQHDLCYQTCGSSKKSCDIDLKSSIQRVCKKAFPRKCPYSGVESLATCLLYDIARRRCRLVARLYKEIGVENFFVRATAYNKRQTQYCNCCPNINKPEN